MKVYVKKDKVLKLLGEGKVFSKKELMLKENGITISQTTPTTPDAFINNSVAALNQTPNAKKTVIPTNMADNNPKDDGPKLTLPKSSAMTGQGKTAAKNFVNQNKDNGQIEVVDDSKVNNASSNPLTTSEGKLNKKVMDEMRANSIPFTKSELTEFLKSL